VYVVLDDGEARKVDLVRWGLRAGASLPLRRPAYKAAFKRRRAIHGGEQHPQRRA
jgi:hypothetical protein